MNGPRSLSSYVARNAAWKGELGEEPFHPLFVLRDRWIDLAVRAFQICIRDEARATVPRSGNIDDVQIAIRDDAIEVHIDEVQAWRRAPVAEQTRLDVLTPERLLEKRVVIQVNLTDRQIVRGSPVRIDSAHQVRGQRGR